MNRRLLQFQLDSLTTGMGTWLFLSGVCGVCTFIVLKDFVPLYQISIWLLALFSTHLIRCGMRILYKNIDEDGPLEGVKRLASMSNLFTACVWGSASFIAMGSLRYYSDTIFTAILLGAMMSLALSNVSDKKLALTTAALVFCPFIFKTYYEQHEYFIIFILMEFLFGYLVYSLISKVHLSLVNNILLLDEKETLLEQLREKLDLERQLKEEKLKSMQASKFAAIGEMAAGIGHEINNPLTIVMGYHWKLEKLMKDQGLEGELLDVVHKSSKACERISSIVNSMRDFSRMKGQGDMENFSLASLIDLVRPLLEKNLKDSGASLSISDFNFAGAQVCGLKSEFAQVLYNLVSNGIQASETLENPEIAIDAYKGKETVILSVSNKGEEISPEIQDKMFQPFFTTKDVGKGTGLGLSLARTIMENNHGEISYEHSNGQNIFKMSMIKAS